jgi:hypothetical protein
MTPESTTSSTLPATRHALRPVRLLAATASALLLFSAVGTAALAQTPTMIVLRAAPAKVKSGENALPLPPLVQTDIAEIKIGGKVAPIVPNGFDSVLKGSHPLQLMVVFDSMQMLGSDGLKFDDIKKFFKEMPPNVEIGIGWLLQGKVKVTQTFTTDRDLVGKALFTQTRADAASSKNDNGNPYACLGNLSAHWPDPDPTKLRAVLMFSDGIIRGNSMGASSDQRNPDVEAASTNLQRAGIIPYPFFYMDVVIPDPNRSEGSQLEGQQNYTQLTDATGGVPLYQGQFSPGSFTPLLDRLYSTLASEAVVTVAAPYPPGKFQRLDVKSARDDIKLVGPDNVMTGNVLAGGKK